MTRSVAAQLPARSALHVPWWLNLLAWVPRKLVALLSSLLLFATTHLSRKDRFRILRNVHAVFKLPPHSKFSQDFVRQVFRHQVFCQLEVIFASGAVSRLMFEGLEELTTSVRKAKAAGNGYCIITPHLGSWDLVGHVVSRVTPGEFFALAKPSRSLFFNRFLDAMRRAYQIHVLWTDSPTLGPDMKAVLRNGGGLGFVMDQRPEGKAGHELTMMGLKTLVVGGPAATALRNKSAVVAVYCLRIAPFRFRVISRVLWEPSEPISSSVMTARMAESMETYIRLYPEQWLWNYRRWREDVLSEAGA